MKLRRMLTAALAVACAAVLLVPAYAHGCHSRAAQNAAQGYELAARCRNDGAVCGYPTQEVLPPCAVEGCSVQGWHVHDGAPCGSHHHGDNTCGGNCVPLCTVEDCHEAGRHTHDGLTYCGAGHHEGWCDGSCIYTLPPAPVQTAAPAQPPAVQTTPAPSSGGHHSSGHHGGHH